MHIFPAIIGILGIFGVFLAGIVLEDAPVFSLVFLVSFSIAIMWSVYRLGIM